MPRIARVIAAGIPHHVTQRGNRRLTTFFQDEDYQTYIDLMTEWCRKCGVEIWAYCLMPNHVHLIAVPETEDGLRRGIGEAHRRYSRMINFRQDWRGHLRQGRFASFPMDASCSGPLCGDESCPCPSCPGCRLLAMEQRTCAFSRRGR